jgi:hypothetical protein
MNRAVPTPPVRRTPVPNVVLLVSAVAAAWAGLASDEFVSRCVQPKRIELKSKYHGDKPVDGGRTILVSVTVDEKGNGSGTITFDPNFVTKFGTTEIGYYPTPIKVRLRDEHDAKGRRIYELTPTGSKDGGDERAERWLLIRPLVEGTPSMLVFTDKNGQFRDVVMVQ